MREDNRLTGWRSSPGILSATSARTIAICRYREARALGRRVGHSPPSGRSPRALFQRPSDRRLNGRRAATNGLPDRRPSAWLTCEEWARSVRPGERRAGASASFRMTRPARRPPSGYAGRCGGHCGRWGSGRGRSGAPDGSAPGARRCQARSWTQSNAGWSSDDENREMGNHAYPAKIARCLSSECCDILSSHAIG